MAENETPKDRLVKIENAIDEQERARENGKGRDALERAERELEDAIFDESFDDEDAVSRYLDEERNVDD
jgi:hypothetical protein